MKRLLLLLTMLAIAVPLQAIDKTNHKMVSRYNSITKTWASYPAYSLREIQYVRPESLAVADAHQVSADVSSAYWTSQVSSLMGDTVVVTGLALTAPAPYDPWFGMTFTQHGWTVLLHDTGTTSNRWTCALVRIGNSPGPCPPNNSCPDTADARDNGFLSIERGDIVTMTVVVEEFPSNRMNSTTQLHPIPGYSFDIVSGGNPIPPPTKLTVDSFYVGGYPGGTVNYSKGEPYEGGLVELHHLTVNTIVNSARGTWAMTDASGNYIADYDASHFYTIGNENPTIPGDPSFTTPPIGGVVDTLRGSMLTVSGGENARGYRISPLYSAAAIAGYTGDVIYGVSLPSVTTHRRYPVVVTSSDIDTIQARVAKVTGGYPIASAHLFLSVNDGPWEDRPMSLVSIADSTYSAVIDDIDHNPLPANTSVKYFIKGIDDHGNFQIYANSSFSFSNDSSKGFFFYTVLDRQLTIHDVQYTPYLNGRSGYLGGNVSLEGIVTADSTDIVTTATGTFGTTAWYIQNGSSPWNGIWVVSRGPASFAALSAMHRGDSVTVTGSVQEDFDVTRILDTTVVIHSSGHALPAPVTLTTAFFNSGNQNVEPYEGMLVKVVGSTLTDVAPVFSETWEYAMDNSGSPMIVRRDGLNTYSNIEGDTVTDQKILHVSDRIDTMVGICYFSHSNWKIIPRKDDDIKAGEPYVYSNGWNMISIGRNQLPSSTGYQKTVLFPTSTSNAFSYNGSYQIASTLEHTKGYWLKFGGTQIVRQLGTKRTKDSIHVVSGWNLVGTIGEPVPTITFVPQPGGNHFGSFFGYAGSYFVEDTLKPSQAYWVKADIDGYYFDSVGTIMVPKIAPAQSAGASIKDFNTLTIADKDGHSQTLYFGQDAEGKILLRDYEMPPASPEASSFDARYSSGRILEAYPTVIRNGMEFGVNISSKSAVTVRWNIIHPEGKQFTLGGSADGKSVKSQAIKGTGEITIGGGSSHLSLTVNGGNLPKEFSLGQNYPNPFNPSTKFEVGLPQAAHLEVVVFNILGQQVATLVDENREAGYQTITWNGTSANGVTVPSGVYFVRMKAGTFTSVRKMMMLK